VAVFFLINITEPFAEIQRNAGFFKLNITAFKKTKHIFNA